LERQRAGTKRLDDDIGYVLKKLDDDYDGSGAPSGASDLLDEGRILT
jgi:hypothetical protein